MKSIKILSLVAAVILVITLFFIFIQPDRGHHEEITVIEAPVADVFNQLNSFKDYTEWSPWAAMDDGAKYTYEGPESGVGATLRWDGKSIGKGSQVIEESIPNKSIKTKIDFKDLNGIFYTQFILEPEGNGTKLTWTYDGENEGFAGKFKWLFMKGPLDTQFTDGLEDFKYFVQRKVAASKN